MTTKEEAKIYLSNFAAQLNLARQADPLKIIGSLFNIHEAISFSLTQKKEEFLPLEVKQGICEWFSEGKLTCYRTSEIPYGERKNSKKRTITTYFFAERDGLKTQLGHATTKNYQPGFWEHGGELLVRSILQKEGVFSYHNHSYVNYILSLGKSFEDLGEKK